MSEIQSQSMRSSDSWTGVPLRAAGLYGELPPLPVLGSTPPTEAQKPRPRTGLTD